VPNREAQTLGTNFHLFAIKATLEHSPIILLPADDHVGEAAIVDLVPLI